MEGSAIKEIIEDILSGDKAQFELIVDRYKKLVASIVYRIVPQTCDREDICQSVFIKVYNNLERFKFKSKLSTWIGKIAYNEALNFINKKKPYIPGVSIDSEESFLEPCSAGSLPDKDAENRDISQILNREIGLLSVKYRTVITLYHLHEMRYQEISEITGLPVGTVKSHLYRARRLLKERLLKDYAKGELLL